MRLGCFKNGQGGLSYANYAKKDVLIWTSEAINIAMYKHLKIQQILTNTTHVLCNISCVWKFAPLVYVFGSPSMYQLLSFLNT